MLLFLDNQQSLGPNSRAGHQPQARPERKSRARDHGIAHARRRRRLHARGRDVAGAHHHRLDVCRPRRTPRRSRQFRLQRQRARAWRAHAARQELSRAGARAGRRRRCRIWRAIRSTAKFIATKLVRHFVADDPPPALVTRLAQRFSENRRRPEGGRARAARRRRGLEGAADENPHALRCGDRDRAHAGARARAADALSRQPQRAGPAAVVAGRARMVSPTPTMSGPRRKG